MNKLTLELRAAEQSRDALKRELAGEIESAGAGRTAGRRRRHERISMPGWIPSASSSMSCCADTPTCIPT